MLYLPFEQLLSESIRNGLTKPKAIRGHGGKMIAMGDSFNDIEMLREAGLGVAMKNSKEGVSDYANLVTVSNNDCGVAKIINEYIL